MLSTALILRELKTLTHRGSCGLYDEYAQHLVAQTIQEYEWFLERFQTDDCFVGNQYQQMINDETQLTDFKYNQNEIKTDQIIKNLYYLYNNVEMFDPVLWTHLVNTLQDQIGQVIEEENILNSCSPLPSIDTLTNNTIKETQQKIQKLKDELEQITHYSRVVHTPLFQQTLSILKDGK